MKVQTRSFMNMAAAQSPTTPTTPGRMDAALETVDMRMNEFLATLDLDPAHVTITLQEKELEDGSVTYTKTVVYAL